MLCIPVKCVIHNFYSVPVRADPLRRCNAAEPRAVAGRIGGAYLAGSGREVARVRFFCLGSSDKYNF